MSNPTPDSGNDTPHEQPTEAVPPPPDHPTDVTAPLPPPNTWQQPPGQPGPQQPAGPNTFITAVNDQVSVLGHLAKSRTVEAFHRAAQAPQLWVVTLVTGAILTGLLVATMAGRVSGAAVSSLATMFGGGSFYFGVTFGAWFTLFITSVVLVGLVMGLRVVALHLTFQMAGKPQPFRAAMSVTATAYSLHLPILAFMLLLVLIPGRSWIMLVVGLGGFLWLLFGLLAELLIYIGMNRATGFQTSPFRMHAITTAVWMIAVGIIYFVTSLILGELATDALGGLL